MSVIEGGEGVWEMMTFADNEDIAIEDRRIFSESHVPIPIPREINKR